MIRKTAAYQLKTTFLGVVLAWACSAPALFSQEPERIEQPQKVGIPDKTLINDVEIRTLSKPIRVVEVQAGEIIGTFKAYPIAEAEIAAYVENTYRDQIKKPFPGEYHRDLKTLLVFGTEADHQAIESLISKVSNAIPKKMIKVFFLKYVHVSTFATTLNRLDIGADLAEDVRTNSLIVSGTEEELNTIEQFIKIIDFQHPEPKKEIGEEKKSYHIQLTWLTSGGKAEEDSDVKNFLVNLPAETRNHLSRHSTLKKDVSLQQFMVHATTGESFEIQSSSNKLSSKVEIEGTLTSIQGKKPLQLELQVSTQYAVEEPVKASPEKVNPGQVPVYSPRATMSRRPSPETTGLEATLLLKPGQTVLMGMAPSGSFDSAFLVQVIEIAD